VDAAGPVQTLTLSDALAFARAHHPRLQAARARVAVAQANARIPRAQWFPSVTLGAEVLEGTTNNTTSSYLSPSGIGLPRIGGTPITDSGNLRPYASTLVAAGAEQELFDFGRIAAQSAAEDALIAYDARGEQLEQLAVQFGAAEAYFAVLAAHEVVSASEQAYERARVHRDEAAAKVRAGLRPTIDLTRADADLTRYDVGRIRAQGGLDVAQSGLAAAIGSPDAAVDTDATTQVEPAPLPPLSALRERALGRQPELARARSRLLADQALTRAIGAEGRPNLVLSASASGRDGGAPPNSGNPSTYSGWVPAVPNWDIGVVLRWPLFDAVRNARKDAAGQREQISQAQIEVLRQQLLADVEQAYTSARVAEASLTALQRAAEAARANYTQAEARFKGGLATTVELADAEAVRTQSEIDVAVGRFNLERARAFLSRLTAEVP
jgi:outer membrane protein TolC